jgi:hypothetical protein
MNLAPILTFLLLLPTLEVRAEDAQQMQEKSAEFSLQYKKIWDRCVAEPTRPLADMEQDILKLHYLWLEVREYPTYQSKPEERMKIDREVAKLVADVEKDKKVRELADALDETPAKAIASLTDPKKLVTLKGWRATNARFQKCLYWLHKGVEEGMAIDGILGEADERNKTAGTKYAVWLSVILSSAYEKADEFGLFTGAGLSELRQGKSATITKGKFAGEEATADHYIPRAVCPELENQIINLRLCPASVNSKKGDKVEKYNLEYAQHLHRDGLLSQDGFDAVKSAYDKDNPMFSSSSYSITPPANKHTIQPQGQDEVRAYMEKDFPIPSTTPAR